MLSILNCWMAPSVRGSKFTADMSPMVVLSRTRAARKNWVRMFCSTGVEPHATKKRTAQPTATRCVIGASARNLLFFVLLGKARDRDRAVVAFDVDQLHALRG